MHYKTYGRATVWDAIGAVNQDLGPSALVWSTCTVGSGSVRGWLGARVFEVTAPIERAGVSEERQAETAHRLALHAFQASGGSGLAAAPCGGACA
jgi:hypothetical protein